MKLILVSAIVIIAFLYSYLNMAELNRIEVGTKVPDFSLLDQNGNTFHLSAYLGRKNLVIYFYPKDDTQGCTTEACAFRDLYQDFIDAGAAVIGISGDNQKSHRDFASSHKLPFILLSDGDKVVRKLFGVPTDLFGLLPGRVTYIIDKNGVVRNIFKSQSQPEKHVFESLKILKTLN
jgi:thioredoxin-dependent peroxiredoxin